MKIKKILESLLLFALIVTMTTSVFAEEATSSLHQEELEHFAYMNLETADKALESKILEARSEIILNTSWVVNGVRGYIVDDDNNIVREIPQFYEIFPSDWDVPVFPAEEASQETYATPQSDSGYWDPLQCSVSLKNPSATKNTKPFTHFPTHFVVGTFYEYSITKVSTGGSCTNRELRNPTYNVGYSNYNTGASLGYSTEMSESESFVIEPTLDIEVAIRASTYSTPAEWMMFVGRYRIDA